jgi:hypothetical protein
VHPPAARHGGQRAGPQGVQQADMGMHEHEHGRASGRVASPHVLDQDSLELQSAVIALDVHCGVQALHASVTSHPRLSEQIV